MKKFANKLNKTLKVSDWFSNRMPIGDTINLNQRSTYILPTKAGLLMVLIIILMMVASTNYQNNLAFLLTFLISSIGIVSIIFTFKNLQNLRFELDNTQSVFAGELLHLNFTISSQSNSPHAGIGVGLNKKSLYYLDISKAVDWRNSKKNYILPIKTQSRGWFSIPKIVSTSCFPFGLLKVWSWFKFQSSVLIYPQAIEPNDNVFKNVSNKTNDDAKNKSKIEEVEFDGIKTYKVGDPISRIDWKSTAKERGMYVKSFESLAVNESAFNWDDFYNVEDELRLSYLCFLVVKASQKKHAFSLSLPGQFIEKNLGETHLKKCLTLLALYKLERVPE